MKTDQIMYCIVALILGMLLANMLKNVCGCKNVVEGTEDSDKCGNYATRENKDTCWGAMQANNTTCWDESCYNFCKGGKTDMELCNTCKDRLNDMHVSIGSGAVNCMAGYDDGRQHPCLPKNNECKPPPPPPPPSSCYCDNTSEHAEDNCMSYIKEEQADFCAEWTTKADCGNTTGDDEGGVTESGCKWGPKPSSA